MPDVLVTVDPGITTGVAVRILSVIPEVPPKYITLTCNPISELWDFLETLPYHVDMVVLEQFQASAHIDDNCERTLEACGYVKAMCYRKGWSLTLQTPQSRIAFLKKAKALLAQVGGEGPRVGDHEMDALAHVLRYDYDHSPA